MPGVRWESIQESGEINHAQLNGNLESRVSRDSRAAPVVCAIHSVYGISTLGCNTSRFAYTDIVQDDGVAVRRIVTRYDTFNYRA